MCGAGERRVDEWKRDRQRSANVATWLFVAYECLCHNVTHVQVVGL